MMHVDSHSETHSSSDMSVARASHFKRTIFRCGHLNLLLNNMIVPVSTELGDVNPDLFDDNKDLSQRLPIILVSHNREGALARMKSWEEETMSGKKSSSFRNVEREFGKVDQNLIDRFRTLIKRHIDNRLAL